MDRAALFVGDVSWDTTAVVGHVPEPDEKVLTQVLVEDAGGVVANAAIACSLAGVDTVLVCGVAADVAGRQVLDAIARWGVSPVVSQTPPPTARAIIILDAAGEKRLVLFPGGRMYPLEATISGVDLSRYAWVHTALYDVRGAELLVERCRSAAVPWSIDLEPATIPDDLAELESAMRGARTVFLNGHAAQKLGTGAVGILMGMGVEEVIETLGAEGARWNHRGESGWVRASTPPTVIDTTGAGDALAGWYVAETLRGANPADALGAAVRAATYSVAAVGAARSYPTRNDILPV